MAVSSRRHQRNTSSRRLCAFAVLLIVSVVSGLVVTAQRREPFSSNAGREPPVEIATYDGRFTFARLRYTTAPGGFYYCGGLPAWAHGYVACRGGRRAETSLMRIMKEISYLDPHVDDSVVLSLDDPALFKYPVAYMTEAGFWTLSDREAERFRAYLQKGGFVIFDDFRSNPRGGGGWDNFEANMRRVLPEARFADIDASHPIFHSFFEINSLDIIPQAYDQGRPDIRGLYEDNDPKKRLLVIANHNADISQYWEFSATGFRPVDEANQAYKLGVNYIMYGLTH